MFRTQLIAVLLLALAAGCASNGKKPLTEREKGRKQWNNARAGVLYSLAKEQYTTGNLDAARKSLDSALALDGENVAIHLLSSRLHIEQGKLEQAEKQLEQVRTLDPKNPEADYLSGTVYQRWQRPEAALEYYRRAAEKAPAELAYLLAHAEMLVTMERLPEALDLLRERIDYFENSAPIRDAVGQLLVRQGKYAEAVGMLRQASLLDSNDLQIREHLALALYYAKQHREASLVLDRLLKVERYATRADLMMALGECQLHSEELTEARAAFESATQLQPGLAAAWLSLSKVALQMKDDRRAELSLRKAMSLEPQAPEAHLLQGYLRLRQDRLSDALAAFVKANALAPNDSLSLCMSGLVLEKQGKPAEAIDCYAKALRLTPDDQLAATLMANVRMPE